MNRQLYANGGIMTVAPREKFGLGSSLKRFVRKIIPNEISAIAVKAAPFVAPFNPALAAGMAGIGGFDQTGRIGSSLKSAALTYGGGQLARYAGGAGFQGNPFTDGGAFRGGLEGFKGGFSSPFGNKTGFGKMLSGAEDVAAVEGVGTEPQNIEGFLNQDAAKKIGLESERLADLANQEFIKNTTTQASDGIFKNYFNVLKSGDMSAIGNATMDMGGKALKAVFTKENAAGNIVLDKTALLAAIVAVPSYLEAKALADEAGLTDEEFNEDLYNAEKADYMTKYQENLPYESFGLKNGGRIGYKDGTDENLVGIETLKLGEYDLEGFQNKGKGNTLMFGSDDLKMLSQALDYGELSDLSARQKEKIKESILRARAGIINPTELMNEIGMLRLEPDAAAFLKKITPDETMEKVFFDKEGDARIGVQKANKLLEDVAFGGQKNPTLSSNMYNKLGDEYIKDQKKAIQREIDFNKEYGEANFLNFKDGGRIGFAFGSPKDKTMFEELNVDTIYRPDDKPSVLEETLEDDKMVSLNSSRLTQLMLALEEAEAKNDMDMIMQIKFDIDKEMKKYAKGGRVNRMFGSPEEGEGITTIDVDMEMEEEPKNDDMKMAGITFSSAEKTYLYRRLGGGSGSNKQFKNLYGILKRPDLFPKDAAVLKEIAIMGMKADGGRIGFGDGTNKWITKKKKNWITKKSDDEDEEGLGSLFDEDAMEEDVTQWIKKKKKNWITKKSDKVEKKEKGGIMGMEVPVRKNQGGVSELDYRNTGGFVPVGVKERADDVPAMLSKNEFVFTADAVRNAGDGNINKGAQKMYNMMKNLENGGTLA